MSMRLLVLTSSALFSSLSFGATQTLTCADRSIELDRTVVTAIDGKKAAYSNEVDAYCAGSGPSFACVDPRTNGIWVYAASFRAPGGWKVNENWVFCKS